MTNAFSALHRGSFLFVLLVVLMCASCAKQTDLPAEQQPSVPRADKESKKCQITKVISNNYVFPGRVFTFEYNDKGDPVKVTPSYISTGSPVLHFKYDKKGRLLEFYGTYEFGGFEAWFVYQYDKNDVIVSDTCYAWGSYVSTPTGDRMTGDYQLARTTNTYEYDAAGRIVRVNTKYPLNPLAPPLIVRNYIYDANGNLQEFGADYDDKMNIRRTNRIWMFVDRNYSVNNELPATTYNKAGLPTLFPGDSPYFMFLSGEFPRSIEYDCKGNLEN